MSMNFADYRAQALGPLRLGGPSVSTKDLFSLQRRTIIVTGGAGALGVNISHAILESGGNVISLDRADKVPQDAWEKLKSAGYKSHCTIAYYRCDITNPVALKETLRYATDKLRHSDLRGLVACAGIALNVSALDNDMRDSLNVFNVNINGTFASAQAAAQLMREENVPGSIVLIASMSAWGSNKGIDTAAYNASKAAVVQLGRSLAAEWGSGKYQPQIRVNTISPGYVKTALTAADMLVPGREAEWSSQNMLNRLSYPDEYRGPAVFLLSDASSFMTGSDLRVDGGHTAW